MAPYIRRAASARRCSKWRSSIKADIGLEVTFVDTGGWDNHVNEGGAQGQLSNLLRDLGQSLAAFSQDMGDRMEDVVVVTMSEFGRTAHENGNRGTDHGHANCMFVMGGAVKGGKVYGSGPGLRPNSSTKGATSSSLPTFVPCSGKLFRSTWVTGPQHCFSWIRNDLRKFPAL